MSLVIIGTVHLDPEGFRALTRALSETGPAIVTVDVSRYAVEFRRQRGRAFIERLAPFRRPDGMLPAALEPVEAQAGIPFELGAAEKWCLENGSQLICAGDDDDSRERLDLFERELMAPENLSRLARESAPPLSAQVCRQWERARACFGRPSAPEPCDGRIAALLTDIIAESRDVRICHVTGWEHLAPLAALLAGFSPTLRLLEDFRTAGHNKEGVRIGKRTF